MPAFIYALIYLVLPQQLAVGMQALQPRMGAARATALATHVLEAAATYGVDPWELVGIAANESDLTDNVTDGHDCGITAARETVETPCATLRRRPDLALMVTAKELAERGRICKAHIDRNRCVLNGYNSGGRYARSGRHGRYYLRIRCFVEAAQGQKNGEHCRRR